jgi:hypothetical protein
MSTFDVIFWILLLVVLLVSTRIATKREKKFAVSKNQFIAKYSFIEEGYVYSEISKHGFSLIDRASGNYGDYKATNVLRKLKDNDEFFIFDFQFTPKHVDKSTASKLATIRVVLIKVKNRELFNFELLPESVFEKIKQVFGSCDIDFEKYPNFSKKYVLKSSEPDILKKTFPETLMEYLENKDGIFIEARKKCLLIYKAEGGEFADYESLYKDAESINNFLR